MSDSLNADDVTTTDDVIAGNDVEATYDVFAGGDVFAAGNVEADSDVIADGYLKCTDDVQAGRKLHVDDDARIDGNLGVGQTPREVGRFNVKASGGMPALAATNEGSGNAGRFIGSVAIRGDLAVDGNLWKSRGAFRIDHPLDPGNKYLCHSFVESPDMMNMYNGNVVLDENGTAMIEMPEWFEPLNRDFRYQLTCIGGFAPVYVAGEINDNRFTVAGGAPGLKVSWQVTGIRHDPCAEANRIPVEEDKPANERGCFVHPELFGKARAKSVDWARDFGSPANELRSPEN